MQDGYVVDAAPIARWAVGKADWQVAEYLRGRNAVIVPLDTLSWLGGK